METMGRGELVGVEWTLTKYVADGVGSVPRDYPLEVTLGITAGGALSATDGCNWLSGPVEVQSERLIVGPIMKTARGCRGPVAEVAPLILRVLQANPDWTIHDRALTVAGAGMALIYEPRRSVFPSDRPGRAAPLVITQGRRGSADYRFMCLVRNDGVVQHCEWRDEPGGRWSFFLHTFDRDRTGPQPNPMACTTITIGDDRVIAGLVSDPATRVTFQPVGGHETDLDLYELPGAPRHHAYIGFLGDPERGSTVHVYDAAGTELGPPHAPHWWLPGDPI